MTFKILTEDARRAIICSGVYQADGPISINQCLTDFFHGEKHSKIIVKSKSDGNQPSDLSNLDTISGEVEQDIMPSKVFVDTSNLVGKEFLIDDKEEGTR